MWTLNDVQSLKNKTILITGGNSGIGFEAALMLAQKDATVIIASSNLEKSNQAVERIKKETSNEDIVAMSLNLGSKKAIKAFVKKFSASYERLDILINNSGVMYKPYEKTEDGFESQMGINHLGHMYVTYLLMPNLKASKESRIVNIASIAHKFANASTKDFFFDNPKGFSPSKGYNRSKLANLLFTRALNYKLSEAKSNIKVYAAHPGIADTSLTKNMKQDFKYRLLKKVSHSAYDGALPTVMAATTNAYPSGSYFGPLGRMEFKGQPGLAKQTKHAKNLNLSLQVWELSEKALNISFNVS